MFVGDIRAAVQIPDTCCETVHADAVSLVRAGLSGEVRLVKMAELFKICGDPTRLKIINSLLLSELCVCDIQAIVNMTQPAVSHHLRLLRGADLVKSRREGKTIYYSLCDEHVGGIFSLALVHVSEDDHE